MRDNDQPGDDADNSPTPVLPTPDTAPNEQVGESRAEGRKVLDTPDPVDALCVPQKPPFRDLEQAIIDVMFDYPEVIGSDIKLLEPQHFAKPEMQCVVGAYKNQLEKYNAPPTRKMVTTFLAKNLFEDDPWQPIIAVAEKCRSKPVEMLAAKQELSMFIRRAILAELTTEEALSAKITMEPQEYAAFVTDVMTRQAMVGEKHTRYKSISAAALATGDYTVNYLIDGILVEGQSCIIGGPAKGLKTSIAVDLAVALATGGYFLGRFPVAAKKRVGVLSAESGMGSLQETAFRVCRAAKRPLAEVEGLVFCDVVPRLSDPADMGAFALWLDDEKPDVVVLDPFYLMANGENAGNVFEMGQPLRALAELCLARGVTPIVCHHLKKTRINPHAPATLDDLTYSGCAEFFRQWVLLSRREPYQSDGNHRMWFTVGGSAGHSSEWALDIVEGSRDDEDGRRWETALLRRDEAVEAAKEAKEEAKGAEQNAKAGQWVDQLRKFLQASPEGRTENQIKEYSGVPSRNTFAVLTMMHEAGVVEPTQLTSGNNKRLHPGWRLRTTPTN